MSRTIKKKLTGAKSVSHQCRNHGSCKWCLGNRMYKHLKKLINYEWIRTNNTQ